MTTEQERWAEAIAIDRMFGAGACAHVAERIGALSLAGDVQGIERWQAVASRLDRLRTATVQ